MRIYDRKRKPWFVVNIHCKCLVPRHRSLVVRGGLCVLGLILRGLRGVVGLIILVPRAHDPSGMRQVSRPLAASKTNKSDWLKIAQ